MSIRKKTSRSRGIVKQFQENLSKRFAKEGLEITLKAGKDGTQRAKITEKVHKPLRNHYIEWPVFSDIGLNSMSKGEKGRTCKKYKNFIGSRVFFFILYLIFLFHPGI